RLRRAQGGARCGGAPFAAAPRADRDDRYARGGRGGRRGPRGARKPRLRRRRRRSARARDPRGALAPRRSRWRGAPSLGALRDARIRREPRAPRAQERAPLDARVPRSRAREPQPHRPRDERAPAADGADRARRELQPWAPDLGAIRHGGSRPALPAGSVKAVFVLGPTASGKTAVALDLAAHFPAEIVSVDSAQVYRGMDIGTAKPDRVAMDRVPHHLIDILDPVEAYSAGRFRGDAQRLIGEIHARARVPILAGGTMLYYRALMGGLADLPSAQPRIRAEIEGRAAAVGWPALHAELARVDAASAARIEPTDAQRIQRALEVHRHTGRPLSEHHGESRDETPAFQSLTVSLEPSDRAVLHARIAQRFRAMLAA